MERKPSHRKPSKNRSILPKTPPIHEEPLRGIEPGKPICEICGKAFQAKSQLDRHMITEHEMAEEKE